MAKKLSTDDFIQKAHESHNYKYSYEKSIYRNQRSEICITCLRHGDFIQLAQNHMNGHGCPKCRSDKMSNLNCKKIDIFILQSNIIHKNKYDYTESIYKKNTKKLIIKCPNHGYFEQSPSAHLQGQGCPSCNSSKGEIRIMDYLINKNINFIREKSFDSFRNESNNRCFKFDFYLPNYNLCIEYDGIQHFKPTKFNGISLEKAKEILLVVKNNDILKNKFCFENNIKLIRIPYIKFNYIEEILEKELYV